jgi:diguanylate cyclase (GGDEF)-like protein
MLNKFRVLVVTNKGYPLKRTLKKLGLTQVSFDFVAAKALTWQLELPNYDLLLYACETSPENSTFHLPFILLTKSPQDHPLKAEADAVLDKQNFSLALLKNRLKQSLEKIKQTKLSLETIFEQFSSASFDAVVLSEQGRICHVNQAFLELFGYSLQTIMHKPLNSLLSPTATQSFTNLNLDAPQKLSCQHQTGTLLMIDVQARSLGKNAAQLYIIRAASNSALGLETNSSSLYDNLTGLKTRLAFLDHLYEANEYYLRYPTHPYAVLFINLDRFNPINTHYGHDLGDEVLKLVSQRILACIRASDIAARHSGDEFIVLLKDIYCKQDALKVAEQILTTLGQPYRVRNHSLHTSASIGVALGKTSLNQSENLLRYANIAMCVAKNQGKNRIAMFNDAMQRKSHALLNLERDFRAAVHKNALEVHYQPIVCLANQEIVSFEALLRWTKADGSKISPTAFIPIAEETNLIEALGKKTIQTTFAHLGAWQQSHSALNMNINLSVKQLLNPKLLDDLLATTKTLALDPQRICLEITETFFISDEDSSSETLVKLNEAGFQVHIDDFGTGYSSLKYLQRLPVQSLKIDKSFVFRLTSDNKAKDIVQAIVTLAKSLGLSTVAEGIETHEQLEYLQSIGCDYGQGFLFSKAVPANTCIELLKEPTWQNLPYKLSENSVC